MISPDLLKLDEAYVEGYVDAVGWLRDVFEVAEQFARRAAPTSRLQGGCAHAFEMNWINLYQVLVAKHGLPGLSPVPMTRDYMYHAL